MTITIDQMVSREVIYCVSHLVSEICKFEGHEAQEQAFALYQGQPDYEEAAIQEGWIFETSRFCGNPHFKKEGDKTSYMYEDWQDVCESENIDPYYPEILEHWIVSNWLADKLIAKGETVDKDFMGLTVWGRRTSGQGIANDYVIEQIYKELVA